MLKGCCMSKISKYKVKGKINYTVSYMFSWLLELQFPQKPSRYVFSKHPQDV